MARDFRYMEENAALVEKILTHVLNVINSADYLKTTDHEIASFWTNDMMNYIIRLMMILKINGSSPVTRTLRITTTLHRLDLCGRCSIVACNCERSSLLKSRVVKAFRCRSEYLAKQ